MPTVVFPPRIQAGCGFLLISFIFLRFPKKREKYLSSLFCIKKLHCKISATKVTKNIFSLHFWKRKKNGGNQKEATVSLFVIKLFCFLFIPYIFCWTPKAYGWSEYNSIHNTCKVLPTPTLTLTYDTFY